MAKIVFINSYNEMKKKNNFSNGIFSLATVLKNNNHNVSIIDFDYLFTEGKLENTGKIDIDIEIMSNYILDNNPEIIAFYTMCNSYYLTIKLSQVLKQKKKELKIIFGGPQATLTAEDTLKICPWVDVIGLGEGERTINNIVDLLVKNLPFTSEKGIAYMLEDQVIINEMDLIEDLDELPKIDYSFFQGEIPNALSIDAGRGCPFSCRYCSTKTFWKRKFRLKSSKRIIEEIIDGKTLFNINKFIFQHDLFTASRTKLLEFCSLVIESGREIEWSCSSRIDTLDEDIIKKMSMAGCFRIFLGVETGSERMQKIINKNVRIDKIYTIVKILKKYNIKVTVSLMYGFPEEEIYDIEKTLEMIFNLRSLGVEETQLHRFTVLPGTEYYSDLKENLYYSNKFSDSSFTKYRTNEMIVYINKHKSIFPQFLDFNINARQELEYLDTYIYSFSKTFMKNFSLTYKLLVEKYGSHLEVFRKFKECNKKKLSELDSIKNVVVTNQKLEISSFKNLIDSIEESMYKETILEIFRFECDLVDFIYYSCEKQKTNNYKYDMYALKENGIVMQKLKEINTSILLTRIELTQINIKKVYAS